MWYESRLATAMSAGIKLELTSLKRSTLHEPKFPVIWSVCHKNTAAHLNDAGAGHTIMPGL